MLTFSNNSNFKSGLFSAISSGSFDKLSSGLLVESLSARKSSFFGSFIELLILGQMKLKGKLANISNKAI
jgi:hypothetical protein